MYFIQWSGEGLHNKVHNMNAQAYIRKTVNIERANDPRNRLIIYKDGSTTRIVKPGDWVIFTDEGEFLKL